MMKRIKLKEFLLKRNPLMDNKFTNKKIRNRNFYS